MLSDYQISSWATWETDNTVRLGVGRHFSSARYCRVSVANTIIIFVFSMKSAARTFAELNT